MLKMGSGLKKRNLILGASGLAKEVFELLASTGTDNEVVFVDVNAGEIKIGTKVYSVIKEQDVLDNYNPREVLLYNAIGFPGLRRNVFEKFDGWQFPNIVANSAILSPTLKLGRGNVFCEGVVITADVEIGNNNYFNLNITVGHDSLIGDHCVVNPGANISGNVTLCDSILVGTGANLLQNLSVGKNSVVGAGACLTKTVMDEGAVLVGIPAKNIKKT